MELCFITFSQGFKSTKWKVQKLMGYFQVQYGIFEGEVVVWAGRVHFILKRGYIQYTFNIPCVPISLCVDDAYIVSFIVRNFF